jgi:hypothetical protein
MPPVTVAAKAIANAALTEMFLEFSDENGDPTGAKLAVLIADELLGQASRVRFQPSTQQLVLTFDLAFNSSEPDTSGPVQ